LYSLLNPKTVEVHYDKQFQWFHKKLMSSEQLAALAARSNDVMQHWQLAALATRSNGVI
jgi:hypothetical protein